MTTPSPDPYTIHAILGGTPENLAFWIELIAQVADVHIAGIPRRAPGSPEEVMQIVKLTRRTTLRGELP
jgi:hypothetical protein